MAKASAVIDVVGAESGAHQLLENISFFVRALGGAEACQRLRAVTITDFLESGGSFVESFLPGRFSEMRPRIHRIYEFVRHLRHALLADHGLGKPLRVVHVVEPEAALHTE